MLKIPTFIKTPTPRRFSLRTRYYDADMENFNQRMNRTEQMNSGIVLTEVESIRRRVRDQYDKHRNRKASFHSYLRKFRIISLTIVLTALAYWILK